MKGYILTYSIQSNSGIISGDDGQRYNFGGADWNETEPPRREMQVDFAAAGDSATEIYAAVGGMPAGGQSYGAHPSAAGSKDKTTAGILAILLGWLGIHKFYLGRTGMGVVYLLCGTVGWVTFGIVPFIIGVISLIEGIMYLSASEEDFRRKYVVR